MSSPELRNGPASRWMDHLDAVAHDAVAVRDEQGSLTYGQLLASARRGATALREDYGAGCMLLVRAEPTTAFVTTLLAVMYSGNTPVPVDPGLPHAAVEFMRQKCDAPAVLDSQAQRRGDRETDAYDARRPALVMFTSGTSGRPKGVLVSDDNLRYSCRVVSDYLQYRQHPSGAVVLPLFYSYALISQVLSLLSVGGRVRMFSDLRNPSRVAAALEAEGIATFCGVPSTFQALRAFHALKPFAMPSVRIVCSAGAPLDRSQVASIRSMFPHARLFNNYGMTEACPRIAYVSDDDPRFAEGSCGRPLPGVEVRIVDVDSGDYLPEGARGMLVVRGPNITEGYINEPALTREAFNADGYLRSGDLARLDGGHIFIEGRCDDVFNCGGEKVAPLEIERALLACPGVEAAVVVGEPHEMRGMVPVAFLRCADSVGRRDVVAHLGAHIARSKVPARFYRVSGFPSTSNGKVIRRELSSASPFVTAELR